MELLERAVADLMTHAPVVLTKAHTLTDAWTAMLNGGFHHVPVCDDGKLIGILSARDVAAAVDGTDLQIRETGVVLTEHTVEGVMSTELVGIDSSAPISQAVRIFAKGRFHALPVLHGNQLVGILTSTDIFRAMVD